MRLVPPRDGRCGGSIMGGFKRFCLLVFSLAGVLCLGALALPWIGPYQQEAISLMDNDYYYYGLLAVLAITGLGLVITLLRAVFTPRKRKVVVVSKSDGDKITVSTKAISSQATHLVEASGLLAADRVQIDTKRNGDVRVSVRVRPHATVDVLEEGQRLHDNMMSGLATVCGSKIKGVNLQFMEAEQAEPDPEPEPIALEAVVEPELPSTAPAPAALSSGEPEKPKRSFFGFGRKEKAPEPEDEPEEPETKRISIDDLVIPTSVYERAAQAEQETAAREAADASAPEAETDEASTHEDTSSPETEGEVE